MNQTEHKVDEQTKVDYFLQEDDTNESQIASVEQSQFVTTTQIPDSEN